MTQLGDAISTLHALLTGTDNTPVATLTAVGVKEVLDHEPAPDGLNIPHAISLAPGDQPLDATTCRVRVRIYTNPAALGPKKAQDDIVATMEALEDLLTDEYGAPLWQYGYADELGCLVGWCDLPFLRDDIST